jgi:hypothetical protein
LPVLIGAVLVGLLALPVASSAAEYQFFTEYAGTYQFAQQYTALTGRPDGLDTLQTLRWAVFDYTTTKVNKADRSYTTTQERYIAALGKLHRVDVQGSDMPGGPFTKVDDCQISSDAKPFKTTTPGSYVEAVPIRANPAIELGWELPDYGSRPTNVAAPFTFSGTPGCGDQLVWTPSSPADALVIASLPSTKAMNEAFRGATTIHYSDIKRAPWIKNISETITDDATRPAFGGSTTEHAQVSVKSMVLFDSVYSYSRTKKEPVNKIGALLVSEGFTNIGDTGKAGGTPAGTSGEDETVVVPGMAPGDVSLDVQSTVIPGGAGNRIAHSSATPARLLSSGKVTFPNRPRPVKMSIVPTALGRSVLAAPHPAMTARYVLRFRFRGSRKTVTRTKSITIPAR